MNKNRRWSKVRDACLGEKIFTLFPYIKTTKNALPTRHSLRLVKQKHGRFEVHRNYIEEIQKRCMLKKPPPYKYDFLEVIVPVKYKKTLI